MALMEFFARSKQLAQPGPLDSFWYHPVQRQTHSGVSVDNSVAMTYSAVWACTRLLSATGSCLPLNLYQTVGDRKAIATEHPVQKLLHNCPNGDMGSMMFRSMGINHQVNRGNFYAEIERDRLRRPMGLWPVHPTRVVPGRADEQIAREHQVEEDSIVYEVRNNRGKPSLVVGRDMLHVPSMISEDGIVGRGVVTCARESIGMGIATERQGASYINNGGRPLPVIKGGRFENDDAREFYRSTWRQRIGSPENAGLPALLPDGAELAMLGFSQEDSQFLQTRQHNVEEIARWYGVPPHMIGHLLRSTFNNIETQSIEFVVYSLIPWLKLWEEEIWRKLLSEAEQATYFAKHNVMGLLRGDSKARADFYQKMVGIGVFSPNDVLGLEDMNPIGSSGDKRFVPKNWMTLDQAGESEEAAEELLAYVMSGQSGQPADLPKKLSRRPRDPARLQLLAKEISERMKGGMKKYQAIGEVAEEFNEDAEALRKMFQPSRYGGLLE